MGRLGEAHPQNREGCHEGGGQCQEHVHKTRSQAKHKAQALAHPGSETISILTDKGEGKSRSRLSNQTINVPASSREEPPKPHQIHASYLDPPGWFVTLQTLRHSDKRLPLLVFLGLQQEIVLVCLRTRLESVITSNPTGRCAPTWTRNESRHRELVPTEGLRCTFNPHRPPVAPWPSNSEPVIHATHVYPG